MPFDATTCADCADRTTQEIARMKACVRQARLEGRLICDHPRRFSYPYVSRRHRGVTYVCAIGAWREQTGLTTRKIIEVRDSFICKLMSAHDQLYFARRYNPNETRTKQLEREFAQLITP
jgi:hypothetical protein